MNDAAAVFGISGKENRMGVQVSWMAFQGITKEEALSRTSLRDTGRPGEMYGSDVIGAELPDGWFLIFANSDQFVYEYELEPLAAGCRFVTFEAFEIVMTSVAESYVDGELVWRITHGGEARADDLFVEGSPPEGFTEIRDRLVEKQEQDSTVDFIFDIPVKIAALLVCGFRHDEVEFAWGVPAFTELEPA
jgi:hypothetical protein